MSRWSDIFSKSSSVSLRDVFQKVTRFPVRGSWVAEQYIMDSISRLAEYSPYLVVHRFLLLPIFGGSSRSGLIPLNGVATATTLDTNVRTEQNARRFLLNVQTPLSGRGHSYYAVEPSPLPVAFSLSILLAGICLVSSIRLETTDYVAFVHGGVVLVVVSVIHAWLMEVVTEVRWGHHSTKMLASFRAGFLYFITSEAMLFGSFFAAFLSTGAATAVSTHGSFVPRGVAPFFYWRIPLVNTLLLWTSGYSLTYATAKYVKGAMHTRLRATCLGAYSVVTSYNGPGLGRLVAVSNQQPWSQAPSTGNMDPLEYFGFHTYNTFSRVTECGNRVWASADDSVVALRCPSSFAEYQYDFSEFDASTVLAVEELQAHHMDQFFLDQMSQYQSETVDYRSETLYPSLWAWDMVVRGSVFLFFQAYEYSTSLFTISDSIYGGAFFALTGLHGVHVLLGVVFMAAFMFDYDDRADYKADSLATFARVTFHRVGWECAAWYWHFVDVVWLYVFIIVYVWGFPTTYDISYAC